MSFVKKLILFILVLLLVLVAVYEYEKPAPPLDENIMEVTFIDVGQGDSSVIILPNTNEVILIDTGEADQLNKVTRFLDRKGIKTIDYLIATHPHSDHIGGMADIVNRYNILNVYMPRAYHDTKTYETLLTAIKNKGLKVTEAKAGVSLPTENVTATFVAPNGSNYEELNDYSAVLRLTYKDKSFLFTGDAEKISENEMSDSGAPLDANVLKVGHHGSSTSSKKKFLRKVKPEYAVICADGVSYNHPHKSTLEALENCNPYIEILSTYDNGNITFLTDGTDFEIKTER